MLAVPHGMRGSGRIVRSRIVRGRVAWSELGGSEPGWGTAPWRWAAWRQVACGLAVLAGWALLAGCGGSGSSAASARSSAPSARASGPTFAERVCGDARQAAAQALGSALSVRIVSPQAASLQCVLTGQQVQVTLGSQAGSRAYTEFDTEVAHQDQVFGPGIHDPSQIPAEVTVPGAVVAVWIPAQMLLVATDATPTTGGTYVTVSVSGRPASAGTASGGPASGGPASAGTVPAGTAQRAAIAAARGTFAAHPDGPS
jgi:hypothetical protein